MSFFNSLKSMAVYAPIPLFAESLRVQRALVSTVLTRHSVSPCLTGCIKDFSRLWEVNDFELLGHFEGSPTASAVSARHGNSFELANKAILDICRITGRRSPKTTYNPKMFRETMVNISFITPNLSDTASRNRSWRAWTTFLVFIFETITTFGISVVMGLLGELVGSALLGCVAITNTVLFILRQWTDPIFANENALYADRNQTVRGGAALDVHVIGDSWNSSQLDVVCGYSSQLHALTNIPVRVNNLVLLKWTCRLLALFLVFQAAALASLTNTTGTGSWSGLVWLSVYVMMLLLKRGLHFIQGPEQLLENQPASVQMVEPLYFSGRRAALVFIASLPVTHKVDRWAYWDVFMPDNLSRREFQAEIETSDLFWKQAEHDETVERYPETKERSKATEMILEEVATTLRNPSLMTCLKEYLDVVFPAISPKTQEV